jgi:hypothetical protein
MTTKSRWLRRYLVAFGLLNIFLISFTVPLLFGDLLLWQPRNLPVEMMLSTVYLAMGIVMIAASRNPGNHKALIDFLILANLAHAIVMLLSAQNLWHFLDVLVVGSLGALPLFFYPWGLREFLRYQKTW